MTDTKLNDKERNKQAYAARRVKRLQTGAHPLNFWVEEATHAIITQAKEMLRDETGETFSNAELMELGATSIIREIEKLKRNSAKPPSSKKPVIIRVLSE